MSAGVPTSVANPGRSRKTVRPAGR